MKIGDAVEYVDPVGRPRNALVTQNWSGGNRPSLNLVFVSVNETETDQYGRQIARETSVVHESNQSAHGRFWRELD